MFCLLHLLSHLMISWLKIFEDLLLLTGSIVEAVFIFFHSFSHSLAPCFRFTEGKFLLFLQIITFLLLYFEI
ncbi:hypothetical protein F4678DRAFT_443606 [Xylaria arbuscula]|nr:hypothetical protein F4678DRAFT_443606 [Xylaria arbuscula]